MHGDKLKKLLIGRYSKIHEDDVIVLPVGDMSIMKNCADRDNFYKKNTSEKKILFFGTIRPNKGLEYLIRAEKIISKRLKNYKIIIAGKCERFEKYQNLIGNNDKFIIINRFIPNREVAKYFSDASIVVLPYISATQTGIIPLAYTFGKPVIATNVGSIADLIDSGRTGILIEPCDENSLANAIIKLLSNDSILNEMSKNALAYCENKLSWEAIANKTLRIYKELVG